MSGRRGFSVAIIGPDGAGKTSVSRRLAAELPFPTYYLYMGDNAEAVNRSLPTTRFAARLRKRRGRPMDSGPPDDRRPIARPSSPLKRVLRGTKSIARAVNQMAEEWYRQAIAWRQQSRGAVVLFDRHFFADYYVYDVLGQRGEPSLGRRLHGLALRHAYPRPDVIVYLDAPPDVLFARKGEGTLESLARRRDDYLAMRDHVDQFHVVDAAQPIDAVVRDVAAILQRHQSAGPTGEVPTDRHDPRH